MIDNMDFTLKYEMMKKYDFFRKIYSDIISFRYSEGVLPVYFLKNVLNDDLELNPASNAIAVIFQFLYLLLTGEGGLTLSFQL